MALIPQVFIDELLNRIDIVETIDSRVKLKKAGKNYMACCPFHNEKTPSFTVSPDKQFYYCFGCGATGTALSFVLEYDRLSFPEAVESLAKVAGLEVPKETERKPNSEKSYKPLYALLEKASVYYQEQLKSHKQSDNVVRYLKERGLSGQIAKAFGLGFAPAGWDNLLAELGHDASDKQALITAGMVIESDDKRKRYDRFRGRIMFPILDTRGRVIGFGGRILGEENIIGADGKKVKAGGPKYLNSPETPVFQKGRELYGLYQAKQANRKLDYLIVVEGYMDVIALGQYGINNAVATLGTACGEEHLKLAFRHCSKVVFCFDGDNAGRNAAKRALENALPVMADGRQINFLFLPEGQDPDSVIRQVGQERFREQIDNAVPLETFFFESVGHDIDARTMEGRANLSKLAAPLLHKLPVGVYKELMFNDLARRTGLSLDVLQELVDIPLPTTVSGVRQERSVETDNGIEHKGEDQGLVPPVAASAERKVEKSYQPRLAVMGDGPRYIKVSPAKYATTILLESPVFAQDLPESLDLSNPEGDEEVYRLKYLIDYLQGRPNSSFHNIIGFWFGQYGADAQKALTQLVAQDFLGSAKRSPIYHDKQEFLDALKTITKHSLKAYNRERRQALTSKASEQGLDKSEKQELLNLLNALEKL